MRTHSTHDDQPHWPWLYSDAHIMRQALIQRYRLLPYHYSLAHRLNTEGELFIRPLAMDFPEDPKAQRGLKMNLMNLKPFPSISKRDLCCGWAGE
eukprot:symbB.v1.2.036400.t1/scaffold5128.1/size30560/6